MDALEVISVRIHFATTTFQEKIMKFKKSPFHKSSNTVSNSNLIKHSPNVVCHIQGV